MALEPDPDLELVSRVIARDDRYAFAELVKRHQSRVRQHLRALTAGDHALADDLAQETFLKAHRSIRTFRGQSAFSTWLYRIAHNAFLNDRRAHQRRSARLAELARQPSPPVTEPSVPTDLACAMEEALATLSTTQTAIFDLHFKKGMTHEEVSHTLKMPLGTVKSHLSRGLSTLRGHLNHWRKNA